MERKASYEKVWVFFMITGTVILGFNLYYYCRPLLEALGWTHYSIDNIVLQFRHGGILKTPVRTKIWTLALWGMSLVVRGGKGKKTPWWQIGVIGGAGLVLYFIPFISIRSYVALTLAGLCACGWSLAMIGRRLHGFTEAENDRKESFQQCTELIETENSINIPTRFKYKKKWHNGWLNVVSPERASLVLGVPGSGKSYSIYEPFIEQMIRKGYSMFVYDYKYPSLSRIVYNEVLANLSSYENKPEFCVINFNDPRYSNRCNPIHPRYISDPADTTEIAELVMQNINKSIIDKEDFFSMSAKEYLDAIIWFLRLYQGGKYCTFPHVIEFMGQDYKKVIAILSNYPELEVKIRPFKNALEGGAPEQLQGQIASAQIPLNKFISPIFYWVLSGDDFSLQINDPKHPKILCVGNDPNRDTVYGTALALFTSRMFKLLNHPNNLKCGVLLDELPTIFIKGLDKLIATARSNKVAIVLGAQDKSQLVRDYKEHEANVIFNTVGNIFSGQVNGKTAEELNKTFGKEFRRKESQTQGMENESINVSFQQEELLPQSTIETLSQGYFFGKIADNFDNPIDDKFFYGVVKIDRKAQKERRANWVDIPRITSFGEEEIRSQIFSNPQKALCEYFKMKLLDGPIVYDPEELEAIANEKASKLSDKKRDKLLEEICEKALENIVEKRINANLQQIRQDIKNIISWETADPEPDAEAQEIARQAEEEDRQRKEADEANRKLDAIK